MVHTGNEDFEWGNKKWSRVRGLSLSPIIFSIVHTPPPTNSVWPSPGHYPPETPRSRPQTIPSDHLGPWMPGQPLRTSLYYTPFHSSSSAAKPGNRVPWLGSAAFSNGVRLPLEHGQYIASATTSMAHPPPPGFLPSLDHTFILKTTSNRRSLSCFSLYSFHHIPTSAAAEKNTRIFSLINPTLPFSFAQRSRHGLWSQTNRRSNASRALTIVILGLSLR